MTSPVETPARDWWTRPRVMFPLLLSLLAVIVLLTPEQTVTGRFGDGRLSSHLASPLGARALQELAARFGWRIVQRDSVATPSGTPGSTVHAVLAPPLAVSAAQAHRYLESVRGGDALLLVLPAQRTPLGDSLGVRVGSSSGILAVQRADTVGCGNRPRDLTPTLWFNGRARLTSLQWVRPLPDGTLTFAEVRQGTRVRPGVSRPVAAGLSFGAGRVVVVADPDLLRNDVLRRCEFGADVMAMRMLEWLRAGAATPRTTIEFDEFHQGFGAHPAVTSVTMRFLAHHPVGRMLLQLMLAAAVLLAAIAPRAILPRVRPRVERRDPLEQADALAHAYEQVHATRTATERLLRGVRARVERGGGLGRTRDDETFLAQAEAQDQTRAADVALVRGALRTSADGDRLPDIGAALRRIEASLTITTSTRA
jgi:hypothetical protein